MRRPYLFALLILAPFSALLFILEKQMVPLFGRSLTLTGAALVLIILLAGYIFLRSQESDEREQFLHLQADSVALLSVLLGLLFAGVFYPESHAGMLFWIVLLLAGLGHLLAFLYQRFK